MAERNVVLIVAINDSPMRMVDLCFTHSMFYIYIHIYILKTLNVFRLYIKKIYIYSIYIYCTPDHHNCPPHILLEGLLAYEVDAVAPSIKIHAHVFNESRGRSNSNCHVPV